MPKNENSLQLYLLDFLYENRNVINWQLLWHYLTIFLLSILILLVVGYQWKAQTTNDKPQLWKSNFVFLSFCFFTLWLLRLPGLTQQQCDIDEGMWVLIARMASENPNYYASGATGGILLTLPLALYGWLGGVVHFGVVKVLGLIYITLGCFFFFQACKLWFGDWIARLNFIPVITVFSTITTSGYVGYNAEHPPIFLIGLALYLLAHISTQTKISTCNTFLLGFTLGCVPFSKLQAVPIAITIGLFSLYVVFQHNKKRIIHIVAGSILPSLMVFVYLLFSGGIVDFWSGYIVINWAYSNNKMDFFYHPVNWERFRNFIQFIFVLKPDEFELNLFIVRNFLATLLGGLVCIWIWKTKTNKIKLNLLQIFSISLLIATIYAIYKPGNNFYHYLLLLVFPSSLLCGAIWHIVSQNIRTKPVYQLLLIPFFSIPYPFYNAPLNKSFQYLDVTYEACHKESVIRKIILQEASPNDKMIVWGFYGAYFHYDTGLMPGTRDPGCTANQMLKNPCQERFISNFMKDWQESRPKIFIDELCDESMPYFCLKKFRPQSFPIINDYLQKNYSLKKDTLGLSIYVRKPTS